MNEKKQTPEHKAPQRPQPTPWYAWPFVALKHLTIISAALIVIEWTGFFGEVGSHAHQQLVALLDGLTHALALSPSMTLHLNDILLQGITYLNVDFQGGTQWMQPYWEGAVYVLMGLALRALMLFASYPLFVLVMTLALIDGLVVRQRRIAKVARETETVHYYAKRLVPIVAIIGGYVWLALPAFITLPIHWVLMSNLVVLSWLFQKTVASYKKFF
ncbi:DUF4400 domain-containing protein [Vibrio lentus]